MIKSHSIQGFYLTLSYTITYLSLIVLIPLSAIFLKATTINLVEFLNIIYSPRILAAYKLSFSSAILAGVINMFFGLIIAWVLSRYSFPGKKLLDSLIDLPFALPTAVAGITLTTLYTKNGWIGKLLAPLGIEIAFTPIGILVALIFVSLPFVVRTVQPVLIDLEVELEEASTCLGATRWQTFRYVILPTISPALLTGFSLSFARAIGEYGAVIFIAGNIPMVSEIVPLVIVIKLEQYDYAGATAIAVVMLVISFIILFGINILQSFIKKG
jgi:sulfate transport system permease protein